MESSDVSAAHSDEPAYSGAQGSKLIEFPGVSRSTVPQWRKELSERVREVQEKRAREEAHDPSLDKGAAPGESLPQLELLPQAEAAPVNPLVAAALRRIERAHDGRFYAGNSSGATAVAYATPMLQDDSAVDEAAPLAAMICDHEDLQPRQAEKAHNLIVVPAPTTVETVPKPKRIIGDINDPALNYLDSVCTATRLETSRYERASVGARVVSAFVDLAVVTILCGPFAAALELTNTNWQVPRTWVLAVGVFSLVGFLYFTISTALTGQTFGLKLFALRIVDVRTGLIPTGTQSAGRALIYQASLILLGITSVFALLNSEGLTAHDRITRTAVVHS